MRNRSETFETAQPYWTYCEETRSEQREASPRGTPARGAVSDVAADSLMNNPG
jgi:hypothetical protein